MLSGVVFCRSSAGVFGRVKSEKVRPGSVTRAIRQRSLPRLPRYDRRSTCPITDRRARRRDPDARLWCVQWELGVLSPPFLMCMEALSRVPFLCWLGLLAPLSAPLPSAVFFLAILRRALGNAPGTALAERQSPAALALVVETVRRLPWRRLVIQPLPAGRCAVRCRTAFRRTTTLRAPAAQQHGNSGAC